MYAYHTYDKYLFKNDIKVVSYISYIGIGRNYNLHDKKSGMNIIIFIIKMKQMSRIEIKMPACLTRMLFKISR